MTMLEHFHVQLYSQWRNANDISRVRPKAEISLSAETESMLKVT